MSWPRLARPRDLVDSLVWRGGDRAIEFFVRLCNSELGMKSHLLSFACEIS